MKRMITLAAVALLSYQIPAFSEDGTLSQTVPTPARIIKPTITPTPPMVNAKAYILIDTNSGKVLAEKDSTVKLPPASLTKMMTLYVVSNALQHNQIHLNDKVHVSEQAWHAEGSRMFIKAEDEVNIENLVKGIIVDSGNDACTAIAEHIGGSELGFSQIMNQQAQSLGMQNSHFTDSTGLPDPNHYTTARDLAILGRALINSFPEYYPWYQQKWFTYNGIRQPNRNRLLWRNGQVDGIKTGHTSEAGFCLVSSAKRNHMRLLAVVLGAPSDSSRADDSERLLNYGFRFFETHAIYQANKPVKTVSVYKGNFPSLQIGPKETIYITIPAGQFEHLQATTRIPTTLQAPVKEGQPVGELVLQLDHHPVSTYPLYALQQVDKGSMLTRMKDTVRISFKRWLG
ncbi:MAG: D-alanyl-D-alanine carboxypeptidase [Gammaproteobacteria bacterium]|nr:D-alanyl-D-alanine carboxypeptidase [Gammaproteobacteria bacterium]